MDDDDFAYNINKNRYGLNELTLTDLLAHFMFDEPLPDTWPVRLTSQYPARDDGTCSADVSEDEEEDLEARDGNGGDGGHDGGGIAADANDGAGGGGGDADDGSDDEDDSSGNEIDAGTPDSAGDVANLKPNLNAFQDSYVQAHKQMSGRMLQVLSKKVRENDIKAGREPGKDLLTKTEAEAVLSNFDAKAMQALLQEALRVPGEAQDMPSADLVQLKDSFDQILSVVGTLETRYKEVADGLHEDGTGASESGLTAGQPPHNRASETPKAAVEESSANAAKLALSAHGKKSSAPAVTAGGAATRPAAGSTKRPSPRNSNSAAVASGSTAAAKDDPITQSVRARLAAHHAKPGDNNLVTVAGGQPRPAVAVAQANKDGSAGTRGFLTALDENHRTELWRAANKGQAGKVALYLRSDEVDVNQVDVFGRTPLWIAANLGRDEVVKLLLADKRVMTNIADNDGHTPLYTACNLARDTIFTLILAKPGVNINRPDRDGVCPLWLAANQGNTGRLVQLLAMPDIEVNQKDNNGVTPFWAAINQNKFEVAKLLLAERNVDANMCHNDGRSPLFVAGGLGHNQCTEMLLAWKGIDCNRCDKDGVSALWAAANQGHDRCVELLLQTPGIDVNRPTNEGVTPLYTAVNRGHVGCSALLLKVPGIEINHRDRSGVTALYAASNLGHVECMKLLLDHPFVDINCTNNNGRTPLFTAAEKGQIKCLRMLLAQPNIKVNHQDTEGCSALCIAGNQGSEVCMTLLLKVPGILVDQYTVDMTPLAARMLNISYPRLTCFGTYVKGLLRVCICVTLRRGGWGGVGGGQGLFRSILWWVVLNLTQGPCLCLCLCLCACAAAGRRSAACIGAAEQQGHRRKPQVASAPQEKLDAGPAVVCHHKPCSASRGAGQAGEEAVVRHLLRGPAQFAHLLALQENALLQPVSPEVALETAQKRLRGFSKVEALSELGSWLAK